MMFQFMIIDWVHLAPPQTLGGEVRLKRFLNRAFDRNFRGCMNARQLHFKLED